jgi:hypothetical protein
MTSFIIGLNNNNQAYQSYYDGVPRRMCTLGLVALQPQSQAMYILKQPTVSQQALARMFTSVTEKQQYMSRYIVPVVVHYVR